MMQGVHLVGEDEDDVYGGFDDYNPAFETEVGCEMKRCQQTDSDSKKFPPILLK